MDTLFAPHSPVARLRTSAHHSALPEVTLFLAPEEAGLKTRLDGWMLKHKLTGAYGQIEGQPVLRLRSKETDRVISALQQDGLVGDVQGKEASPEDGLPKPTFAQRFKSNIVRYAAAVYIFSNTTMMLGGFLRHREASGRTVTSDAFALKGDDQRGGKNQMIMGGLFNLGDLLMLTFGHRSVEQQLDSVSRRLGSFAERNSWTVPDSSPIRLSEKRNDSFGERIANTLREHIIHIKAAAEITASYFGFQSGKQLQNTGKQVSSSLIASGFILSQAVPERKSAHFREQEEIRSQQRDSGLGGKETPGLFGRIGNAIQRKPMLLTGLFTVGNNVAGLIGAAHERKTAIGSKNFWAVDATAQTAFIGANTLLALSSKNNTERAATIMEHAYGMASDLILCQTAEIRPIVLEKLANFLAEQPEVDATVTEAKTALEAMVAAKDCLLERPQQPALAADATKELAAAEKARSGMVERLGLEPRKPTSEKLPLQREHAQNHRPEPDAVPSEWRETVRGQEAQQEAHHYERG